MKKPQVSKLSLSASSWKTSVHTRYIKKTNGKFALYSFCGRGHFRGECLARRKTYIICNKKEHFANVYHSKKQEMKQGDKGTTRPQRHKNRNIHTATQNRNNTNSSEDIYFNTIQKLLSNATEAYA